MIDPNNIINFNRTDDELEELILFLVCVAGKKASTVSKQLNDWLLNSGVRTNPFAHIMIRDYIPEGKTETTLLRTLKEARFGQYNRLERAFRELAKSDINLRTCSLDDLMGIHGIGRKSASCFLCWTRKGEERAMLDTHLLKYLNQVKWDLIGGGYATVSLRRSPYTKICKLLNVDIPKSTPTSHKLYDRLELAYIKLCRIKRVNPTEYDLEIWRHYSQGLDKQKESAII